ncbi:hypothetical protein [Streptomyces griseocarneus]|uniref:hypothetical protein n=1 Tax=Streptomyces griseocarneus TaxID=51201 RepID=UPI00167DF3D5|nr:hypothetical protein [Streptomyces griseocarneus]MBZ6474827.1 hypothetical protein [Streptomyces griseocarneus]GHG48328.1 hypothetical protein GCM10018779_06460 [Streptomyces griseocarneus]
MSDTDTGADPLLRIAAAIDRERDPASRACLTCGGPTRVVVREQPARASTPVISVGKECAVRGCERP